MLSRKDSLPLKLTFRSLGLFLQFWRKMCFPKPKNTARISEILAGSAEPLPRSLDTTRGVDVDDFAGECIYF